MATQKKKKELNLKQKKFCEVYTSAGEFFGNGVHSYMEAYALDKTKKTSYETAKSNAYQLLTNTHILTYINSLLDSNGLNDENVDKQLLFLINQNADFTNKRGAIQEYNKLRQRIIEKQEIEHKGHPYNQEFMPNGSK